MTELDHEAKKLLDLIVSKLHMVDPGKPWTYLFYDQVRLELRLPEPTKMLGETPGTILQDHGLNVLAWWTRDAGKPMVTGVIVNQNEPRMPSAGYFTLNASGLPDAEWWRREVEKAVAYDWTSDVSPAVAAEVRSRRLRAATPVHDQDPPDTPISFDTRDATAPPRVKIEVYRTLRDTALARSIKEKHGNICQICRKTTELFGGKKYSEAHHIKPLGLSYGGLDVEGNILCVCPTCHVLLDYGAIKIDFSALRTVDGHEVDEQWVDYHNEKLYGKK